MKKLIHHTGEKFSNLSTPPQISHSTHSFSRPSQTSNTKSAPAHPTCDRFPYPLPTPYSQPPYYEDKLKLLVKSFSFVLLLRSFSFYPFSSFKSLHYKRFRNSSGKYRLFLGSLGQECKQNAQGERTHTLLSFGTAISWVRHEPLLQNVMSTLENGPVRPSPLEWRPKQWGLPPKKDRS